MVMEAKQFEQLLDTMGISYTHTATKPTAQLHPSRGRYSTTGDWVEIETEFNTEPTGVKITDLPKKTIVCEYCSLVVDKAPLIWIQCKPGQYKMKNWKVKCADCKCILDFATFKPTNNSQDK